MVKALESRREFPIVCDGKKTNVPLSTMNRISVPNEIDRESIQVLSALAESLDELTPEVKKAAAFVLENPNNVSVSSIREIAAAADVKPNTVMRLAQSLGFDGYEDFREPFRDEVKRGITHFPDRAAWLQSLGQSGKLGQLYQQMVSAAIDNLEDTFAGVDSDQLQAAARAIAESRNTYTLGVGVNHSNAQNFSYLAGTGMKQVQAIPKNGSTATDDLAWADNRDVLIAMTSKPYRQEVVDAVSIARQQGVTVIGLSDSPASPIIAGSDFGFVLHVDTPQFFPSSVSTVALLETLLSFVIAVGKPKVVDRVRTFHDRRHELGLYVEEG